MSRFGNTSSSTYLVEYGSTNPAARLKIINTSPTVTDVRCSQSSARASAQARLVSYLGLPLAGGFIR